MIAYVILSRQFYVSIKMRLFLLFISSLGGESFDQTWTAIPTLVFILIVSWIEELIRKRKSNKEDNE
jgi:hypothetical protein